VAAQAANARKQARRHELAAGFSYRVAANHRQPALFQAFVVLGQRLGVLVVGVADLPDGRDAERHQVAIGLGAVALEIAVQPAFALGHGK
jgi:hypothetical protein